VKEKLQEYALVDEVISTVAIIISLVILIFQVQMSTEATVTSSREAHSSTSIELLLEISSSED